MKKKLLFLTLTIISFISYAQFEVKNYNDDTLISDGQTISFTESGCGYTEDCNWKFKVTNTSATETLYMKIFVDNMVNSDGSSVQLCFNGVCLNSVNQGSGYPSTAASLAPSASTGPGNYFWNQNPSGTTTAMSWTLRFQPFDAVGNEVGSPLTVTYSYNSSLSVDDAEISNLDVYPTSVKNQLNISSDEDLSAEFFDLTGRKIKQLNITSGNDIINTSDLSSQIYFIRFTNESGQQSTRKIVKE